jgi:hypothetical protein
MKYPDSPYSTFGFYFATCNDAASFVKVLRSVLEAGARLSGEVVVHRRHANEQTFAASHDLLVEERRLGKNADEHLWSLFYDSSLLVTEVGVIDAVGVKAGGPEKIAYGSISPKASVCDSHPILLHTTGWMFTGDAESHSKDKIEAGKRLYESFIRLVNCLQPDYANISFDWGLECPTDLRSESSYVSFRDFYVSNAFAYASDIASFDNLFQAAFTQLLRGGKYYSTCEYLNPEHKGLAGPLTQRLSSAVSERIGRRGGAGLSHLNRPDFQ